MENRFFTVLDIPLSAISKAERWTMDLSHFSWFYSGWSKEQKLYAVKNDNPYKGFKAWLWGRFNEPEYLLLHCYVDPTSETVKSFQLYKTGDGSLDNIRDAIVPIEREYYRNLANSELDDRLKAENITVDSYPLWIDPELMGNFRVEPDYDFPSDKNHFSYGFCNGKYYLIQNLKPSDVQQELTIASSPFSRKVLWSRAFRADDKDSFIFVGPFDDVLGLKKWILENIDEEKSWED